MTIFNIMPSSAVGYYVDATGGDDDNNGLSAATPWQTIAKVNAAAFDPGDHVLFKRGETFSDASLTIDSHGSAVAPILYSYYGSGARPLISGMTDISGTYNTLQYMEFIAPSNTCAIQPRGSHNIVEYNYIHNTAQDGIHPYGSYNIIRGNYIYDLTTDEVTHIDFFQSEGPLSNTIFEGNLCINLNTTGISQIAMIESPGGIIDNLIFRNNIFVIAVPGYTRMAFNRHAGEQVISNITVVNNTFYHVADSWDDMGFESILMSNITTGTVKNNLIVNFGNAQHRYILVDGTSSDIDVDYNCVYKIIGSDPLGGPYPHDVWLQDPKVVSLVGLDFHLLVTSPCIAAGDATVDCPTDYDDVTRGAEIDIGAFEYV